MKSNKTLNVADRLQNLHPEVKNIIEMVQLWTGSEYVNLHDYYGTVWTKVFHNAWGPCYTFDLSKVDKFKYVFLEAGKRSAIEFVMAQNNLWKTALLMLHTRFDLPDALQLNGYVTLPFMDENQLQGGYKFEIGISYKIT